MIHYLEQVNANQISAFPEANSLEFRATAPGVLKSMLFYNRENVAGDIIFDILKGTKGSNLATIFGDPGDRPEIASGGYFVVADLSSLNLSLLQGDIISVNVVSGSGNIDFLTAIGIVESADERLLSLSKSVNYTFTLADKNKYCYHPISDDNPRTWTIPANSSVPYEIGTTLMFINDQNTVTIDITSDTLVLLGTGTTGSRTLAENGLATAIKVDTTRWVISGTNLS